MKEVLRTNVRQWTEVGGRHSAKSVAGVCAYCGEKVVFALGSLVYDEPRNTIAGTAPCPGCGNRSHFWTVNPHDQATKNAVYEGTVFMFPAPPDYREAMRFGASVPEELQRSYLSTVDSYNSRNYVATSVCCRRTLEGLFKFLLPEEQRTLPLARAIERATESTDLAKPLKDLSHAIRAGGNLGAHFDMAKEPSQALARAMVELLEYIINYLYVLPAEISQLDREISGDA